MGCYPILKDFLGSTGKKNKPILSDAVAAGLTTGALGAFAGNPFDLVKTRFQAEAGTLAEKEVPLPLKDALNKHRAIGHTTVPVYATGLYQGSTPQYMNTGEALLGLRREPGGWVRGVLPSMARASLITASQCVSYDWSKQTCVSWGYTQGMGMWVICG